MLPTCARCTLIALGCLVALVAGVTAPAPVADAAESYDLTTCGASTVTTIAESPDVLVQAVDTKGIARANTEKKAFDNATYQCANLVRGRGAERELMGYCKFMDPDGDFVVGQQTLGPAGAVWKLLHGTGKWKGITGGGTFAFLTSAKPILPGTGQACARATGTYELSR